MLLRESGKRTFLQDRQLGSSLAMVAGALNSAGFLSVGYYCANMTGNISMLASASLQGKVDVALMAGSVVLCFWFGALLCTLLVNRGRHKGLGAVYAYSILLEAFILVLLGLAQLFWFSPAGQVMVAPLVLAFLMGMQNATVTRISGAVVRTTHVTGMITDLGIEMADWLTSFSQPQDAEKHQKMQKRLWLHSQIIVCFILGSALGVYIYTAWPEYFLLGAGGVLACLALPGVFINMRKSSSKN
ncbi:DUF1275 domain-containing protein [Acetobacter orientalis]|uniref:YoaK family protein n=1 Tax=Acetobacter orientalis TaxID=146474 RepID=UPI00209E270E|nr:YoaK family protein [Acetobacter orientalis]MCP1216508.1 DUF1275 domain-containing protein [Acetobacter orientalis]MCP1219736.1 DUF1275 domain-containing protein [Acetobacter orientalis]